jgi:hypothetical protein
MVTSLAIVGLIAGSVVSTTVLLARSTPREGDSLDAALRARRTADRVVRELSLATNVVSASRHSAVVDVPDRDGDGNAERIAISWSGQPGDPLTLSVNGNSAVLEENVHTFELDWHTEDRTTQAPGAPVEAPETLLASWNGTTDTDAIIKSTTPVALGVRPRLPTDATAYRVTRARLWLGQAGKTDGTLRVELRSASGLQPSTSTLASVAISESALKSKPEWVSVSLTNPTTLGRLDAVFLVLRSDSADDPATAPFAGVGIADDRTSLAIGNSAVVPATWAVTTDAALPFELYGIVTMPSTVSATTSHVTSLRAAVKVGSGEGVAAFAAGVLANAPGASGIAADTTPTGAAGDVFDISGDLIEESAQLQGVR